MEIKPIFKVLLSLICCLSLIFINANAYAEYYVVYQAPQVISINASCRHHFHKRHVIKRIHYYHKRHHCHCSRYEEPDLYNPDMSTGDDNSMIDPNLQID